MDDEISDDFQKVIADTPMDTDEGPLINENSNGLSHLLTEGEFNSVDAVAADESSTSNQGFLNAVELSGGSVGDYLDNNTDSFNANSFDVGDNAVTFPSDSLSHVLSDGDSHISDGVYKANDTDIDGVSEQQGQFELESEISNDVSLPVADRHEVESESETKLSNAHEQILTEESVELTESHTDNAPVETVELIDSPSNNGDDNPVPNTSLEVPLENCTDSNKESGDAQDKNLSYDNSEHTDEIKTIETVETTANKESEVGGAEETEVVSEDELPAVEKPKVKDAENVSDDELPGPKPAELPADTEVVSEDELPSSKKDGRETRKRKNDDDKGDSDGGSQTSVESANKKQAVVKNGESKPIPAEKRSSTDEKPKKKELPELDKYWKVVNEDPTDFTGWTYLLQYVDQEGEVEAAREAYDAFLSHYPYCYGYWRKYADYEKRKGSKKKCLEVLERGLKAIPLSVDLWIHYLNHVKTTRVEDHAYIRSQYERAIEACGLEFRSDRLWESYIKWEQDCGSARHVTRVYDRLLATPTLGYTSHFEHFQEHVAAESVSALVDREEVIRLRSEVRAAAGGHAPPLDLPPGEDEPPDHIASDEEAQAIKELIIQARKKVHKLTGEEVAARWTFEEGIKRPYFHVKPLERCQLKNWKSYLEWEKQRGSFRRALVLHERCLIACALYDEFWMRLVKFLEERIDMATEAEKAEAETAKTGAQAESPSVAELVALEREVLERACGVHHLDKPDLHLHWAHFEEAQGHAARAADILERVEKTCPGLVQIQYRRVNLERRRGDLDKCVQLYESYIASAKSKSVASALAIKYARFLFHVRSEPAAARRALDAAAARDPLCAALHLQRLDLALHTPGTPYADLEELVTAYEKQENAEAETVAAMAWRRRELAEELGGAAAAARAAATQRALARQLRKRARKEKHDPPPPPSTEAKKKESSTGGATSGSGAAGAASAAAGNSYYTPPAQAYEQQYAQSYQQPPWGYQQPPGPYQHQPWPQYPNYY